MLRLIITLLSLLSAAPAAAAIDLCVQVQAEAKQRQGLARLVRDALGHFLTHRQVTSGCPSRLQVELIQLAGVSYLIVRINREVPVRYTVKRAEDLAPRLTEALQRVLGQDPVYLAADIQRYSALQRAMHSVLKGGRNTWRVELFEAITSGGTNAAFASGGAFSVTRGSANWFVFARLYGGGSLGGTSGTNRALRLMVGGDLGLSYELLARSTITPYFSAGLGLQLLHYEGRLRATDRDLQDATAKGATVSLRAGLRFFRASDFDLDLFAAGYLPLFATDDPDSQLMDAYTPSLQLGLGVGF